MALKKGDPRFDDETSKIIPRHFYTCAGVHIDTEPAILASKLREWGWCTLPMKAWVDAATNTRTGMLGSAEPGSVVDEIHIGCGRLIITPDYWNREEEEGREEDNEVECEEEEEAEKEKEGKAEEKEKTGGSSGDLGTPGSWVGAAMRGKARKAQQQSTAPVTTKETPVGLQLRIGGLEAQVKNTMDGEKNKQKQEMEKVETWCSERSKTIKGQQKGMGQKMTSLGDKTEKLGENYKKAQVRSTKAQNPTM